MTVLTLFDLFFCFSSVTPSLITCLFCSFIPSFLSYPVKLPYTQPSSLDQVTHCNLFITSPAYPLHPFYSKTGSSISYYIPRPAHPLVSSFLDQLIHFILILFFHSQTPSSISASGVHSQPVPCTVRHVTGAGLIDKLVITISLEYFNLSIRVSPW